MGKQDKDAVMSKLHDAIMNFNEDEAKSAAEEAVKSGADVLKAVEVMGDAMSELGKGFEKMEVFLPEIVMASGALKEAMKVLQPKILELAASGQGGKRRPIVIIGTVKGDVHTVGKDMVATMMMTSGFDVVDLGHDVSPSAFLDKAKELSATIIAASALMSTTLPVQKDLIDFLNAKNMRQQFKVMVGGGVATKEWAERIGADGYGQDAIEGVEIAKKLTA
ncbi:MAG: cobalamin-dependent protein [Alphaproteobacteria bacterium]|uniref:Cobalamin-dependent protein n=1 Tax=Candidatus Nitrobium versatile TaxID=2884831 RepID=A0A953M3Q0_9BACT|nr:cobalamin-dependent protein [Candidatus Nitrobium versatile]